VCVCALMNADGSCLYSGGLTGHINLSGLNSKGWQSPGTQSAFTILHKRVKARGSASFFEPRGGHITKYVMHSQCDGWIYG